ncbi:MAG: S41 family peptidase [Terricaulis sp.]
MRTCLTAAALAALFVLPATAQQNPRIQPRAVVESIAQTIEQNYFDPTRAHAFAAELRANAAHGNYDHDTNPLDLAAALTATLHPHDGHFTVRYEPQPAAPVASGPPQAPPISGFEDATLARENYGFRRVDILPGGVGVIAMNLFADFDPSEPAATQPARQAADNAIQAVSGARAIIIDLRGSRGGAPQMVGYIAGYFTPAGANIFNTFHSPRGDMSEAPTGDPTRPRLLDTPLYILVDGATGSAAESFPYTLQAAHRATIVGERTDGRANPGGPFPAAEGFTVFVSVASPENPITHTNWEGTGVQPDVATTSADALTRAHQLALERIAQASPQSDAGIESQWTLDGLRARPAPRSAAQLAPYVGDYGLAHIAIDGDHLTYASLRRPPLTLIPLTGDTFVGAAEPYAHYQFDRSNGRVTAVNVIGPHGPTARYQR